MLLVKNPLSKNREKKKKKPIPTLLYNPMVRISLIAGRIIVLFSKSFFFNLWWREKMMKKEKQQKDRKTQRRGGGGGAFEKKEDNTNNKLHCVCIFPLA